MIAAKAHVRLRNDTPTILWISMVGPHQYHKERKKNMKDDLSWSEVGPELLAVLKDAEEHLDYCGYGDSYERQGAIAQKLPERIAATIAKAEKLQISSSST